MKTLYYKRYQYLRNSFFIWIVLSMIIVGCKKDDAITNEKNNVYLIDYSFITILTKTQVLLTASQYPAIYNLIYTKDLSDIKVYKIKYKTVDVAGEEIFASGVVLMPITENSVPILSYQHGTITNPSEAPSLFFTCMEARGLAAIFASTGYAISVPDYLGYGESSTYPHPYEHAKTLATASFDMLMAAKEFFKEMNVSTSDKLFITGYSEGGNATMALHKYIEENSDLVITMSAPASGAYNKTAFSKDILQKNEDLIYLPNFMWVIDAYNWIYGLNRSWNQYVNEPDATKLEAVTDPFNLSNTDISHNPQILFTSSIIDGVLNNTDTEFLSALADNDNFDWTPNFPITLYYSTADDYVFPLNSETAYEALSANGATVTKVVFDGFSHGEAFIPYAIDMFTLFESLK